MSEKKQRNVFGGLLKDIVKALGIGLVTAVGLAVVLFAIGALTDSRRVATGLEIAKDGLFLGVALELFLLAGMLLLKGKKPEPSLKEKGWEEHFQVISVKPVLVLIAVAWIAVASVLDYISLHCPA